jgi:hypothetical protein
MAEGLKELLDLYRRSVVSPLVDESFPAVQAPCIVGARGVARPVAADSTGSKHASQHGGGRGAGGSQHGGGRGAGGSQHGGGPAAALRPQTRRGSRTCVGSAHFVPRLVPSNVNSTPISDRGGQLRLHTGDQLRWGINRGEPPGESESPHRG